MFVFCVLIAVLPQLVGLCVLSSNGLLLKGGRESTHSLAVLYDICVQSIAAATAGTIDGSKLIALLGGREEVAQILKCDHCIDLVIPRGSAQLVKYIQQNTHIPVMGHSEGRQTRAELA